MRRHRHLPGRTLAAAATTALVLTLSGCGGGEDGASDSSSSGDVPDEGATVEPADFVDDMTAGLEASSTAVMQLTADAGGSNIEAEGEIDYSTDPVSMAMEMSNPMMADQPVQLRMVDGVVYLNAGPMTNEKFVSYDLSDPTNLPPGLSGLTDQLDPLAQFQEFEDALTKVTFVGEEEVDGETLAHYDLLLDPTKMETFEGAPESAGLPEEIPYELWFDDEFRIRQMKTELDMTPAVSVDIKLDEWGEPVEIEAPPADDVVDGSQMAG